uniref:Uncharacterized protein n=1 Tax=viral metagenome TaxID=1070528 RepID=A0A6C0EBQ1_9ZZZZ
MNEKYINGAVIVILLICLAMVYGGYFWGYSNNRNVEFVPWIIGVVGLIVSLVASIATNIYAPKNQVNKYIPLLLIITLPVLIGIKYWIPIITESNVPIKTGDRTDYLLEKSAINMSKPYDKMFVYSLIIYCVLAIITTIVAMASSSTSAEST